MSQLTDEDGTQSISGKPTKEDAIRTVAIMSAILATRVPIDVDGEGVRTAVGQRPIGPPDLQSQNGADRVAALAVLLYEAAISEVDMYEQLWRQPGEARGE